jgi:hypothetical protein
MIRVLLLGVLGLLGFALVGCANTAVPTPTQAKCPTPDPQTLTYDDFGMQFMASYCITCHDSGLSHSQRNGAPLYHDYDTLMGILSLPDHIDEYAGSGPASHNTEMPPGRCPSVMGGPLNRDCPEPSEAEREMLSIWLACERTRSH